MNEAVDAAAWPCVERQHREAVPERVRVERRRTGLFGPKTVRSIALDAGDRRLALTCRDGAVEAHVASLSRGIVIDPRAETITLHLTEPDPDLLDYLAGPFGYVVPADHPFGERTLPPGTGPYRVASFDAARGARLVRNPYFRTWSNDARPVRCGHKS